MDTTGMTCHCGERFMSRKEFFKRRAKTLIGVPADAPRVMRAIIPVRILVFVLIFVELALLIFLSSLDTPELRDASAIMLIAVTSAYLFMAAIHVIGHFGGSDIVEFPMLFASFVGIICFILMGSFIAYAAPTRSWARLISFVLCFCIGFLYAAEILLTIGYWRSKVSNKKSNAYSMTASPYFSAVRSDGRQVYAVNNRRNTSSLMDEVYAKSSPQLNETVYIVPKAEFDSNHHNRSGQRYDDNNYSTRSTAVLNENANMRYTNTNDGNTIVTSVPVHGKDHSTRSGRAPGEYAYARSAPPPTLIVGVEPTAAASLQVCRCEVQACMTSALEGDKFESLPRGFFGLKKKNKSKKKAGTEFIEVHYSPDRRNSNILAISNKNIQTETFPIQREMQTTRIEVQERPVQTSNKFGQYHTEMDAPQHRTRAHDLNKIRFTGTSTPTHKSPPSHFTSTYPMSSSPSSPMHKNNTVVHGHGSSTSCGGGSCECAAPSTNKKTKSQFQPDSQPTSNLTSTPRRAAAAVHENFDHNLSTINYIVTAENSEQIQKSQRDYKTREAASRTKPAIQKLPPLSPNISKSSSSSVIMCKNKRTQTKGENSNDYKTAEKGEDFRNDRNKTREKVQRQKSPVKEIEMHSINLNSMHKMPRPDLLSDEVILSHDGPSDQVPRRFIKRRVKTPERDNSTPRSMDLNLDSDNISEVTFTAVDVHRDMNIPKSRTKTLYRDLAKKPPESPTKQSDIKKRSQKRNIIETETVSRPGTYSASRDASPSKPRPETKITDSEISKPSGSARIEHSMPADDFDRSLRVNVVGNSIRKISCPVCNKSKWPCYHCEPPNGKN